MDSDDDSEAAPAPGATDTVAKVQQAVLEMLAKDGPLAGINLNEVAKRAGVNRTLVYHHFGTRQELLRSAIRRRMQEKRSLTRTPTEPLPLGERVVHALRNALDRADTLQLMTLLHLDGSTAPRLMPNAATTLVLLERDRALGLLPRTDDLPALHTAYAATVYGYALFREIFARDLGLELGALDERFAQVLPQLFRAEGAGAGAGAGAGEGGAAGAGASAPVAAPGAAAVSGAATARPGGATPDRGSADGPAAEPAPPADRDAAALAAPARGRAARVRRAR
ncbi:TetR/AcrR family transcriptional regulator [Piscinibacter sakaiensis]|uniref:HTH tetR-type domain-containing protein n=1 Tax=Piscinibacter sakaiensis TaxID=1547922 RepID=A0A0K8P9K0_PISS1|nr:TetR/AcrR family transcriptional regulator [Piscinibacter sakaiensis]GAP38855.1 hypothetical protein ISF6_5514 [Piscinibacter sakaiensis]